MSNPKGGNRKGSQGRRIWLSAEAAALMDSVKKDLGYGSTGTDSLVIVQALSTLKLALRGGALSSIVSDSANTQTSYAISLDDVLDGEEDLSSDASLDITFDDFQD